MKALSVRQPWAWAIVNGFKAVENRSRRTHFRGRILIHAPATFDQKGLDFLIQKGIAIPDTFELGGIVGEVNIVDCIEDGTLVGVSGHTLSHEAVQWFTGRFGWLLESPRIRTFKACKGQLGIWECHL